MPPTFDNPTICKACGGKCCKNQSGALFPIDVGSPPTVEAICDLLRTGRYVVDWWEGDPREDCDDLGQAYFLRPATTEDTKPRSPSWGGQCVFGGPDGCDLEAANRPTQCRALEPSAEGYEKCVQHASKQDACIAWIPHHQIIEAALAIVEEAREA